MRRVTRDRYTARSREINRFLEKLPAMMHEKFVEVTPIDTGNAKSKTELNGNEIQGNYDYANRLNTGWSKQAPQGMTDQVIDHVREELRKLR